MFSVKKVRKYEYAHLVAEAGIVKVYSVTAKGWAVADENGVPVCHLDETVGKPMFEVFDRKVDAQMQADWMNRNAADIELLSVERYDS